MKIYILCAPEDDKVANQLGWLVSLQITARDNTIRVQPPSSAAVARELIDDSDLIVFLLSPDAVRVPWLAEVAQYAMDAQGRGAPKLVVRAELWPDSVSPWPDDAWPNYAQLDEALHDAYPTSGNLGRRATQIAYYASFRLVQSGGFMGWQPTRPPDGGGFTHLGGKPSPSTEEAPAPAESPSYEQPPAPPPMAEAPAPPWQDQELPPDVGSAPPPYAPPPAPGGAPPPAPGGAPPPPRDEPYGQPAPAPAPWTPAPPPPVTGEEKRARGTADVTPSASKTLQFSAYHPNVVAVETWHTLLVYTYVAEALAAIQADAGTFTELGSAPTIAKGQSARTVERGVELTVEPHMEGVTFSPATDTFVWREDWRRSLFRFSGAAALAGHAQRGWIDIYAGPMVPIARIDITFPFRESGAGTGEHHLAVGAPRGMIVSSNIYDAVFISYSHRDREAFRQACEEYHRFGITVYTDEKLEAGANYEVELARMIAEANIFHLLWSRSSATSPECRKEWRSALQREPTERFIKPWFWRQPLPPLPDEFAQHRISFKYEPLKRHLLRPETWF